MMWRPIGNRKFGSNTAVLSGSYEGGRICFSSLETIQQVVFVADTSTNTTIGRIEVSMNGGLQIHDGPVVYLEPGRELDREWKHHITAILGVPGPTTINITDDQGIDTDILRLKNGHSTWFVPARYKSETPAYDFTNPDVTEPTRQPPTEQANNFTERCQAPKMLTLSSAQRSQLQQHQPTTSQSADRREAGSSASALENRPMSRRASISALHQRLLLPKGNSISDSSDDEDKMPPLARIKSQNPADEDYEADSMIDRKVAESLLDQPVK